MTGKKFVQKQYKDSKIAIKLQLNLREFKRPAMTTTAPITTKLIK